MVTPVSQMKSYDFPSVRWQLTGASWNLLRQIHQTQESAWHPSQEPMWMLSMLM